MGGMLQKSIGPEFLTAPRDFLILRNLNWTLLGSPRPPNAVPRWLWVTPPAKHRARWFWLTPPAKHRAPQAQEKVYRHNSMYYPQPETAQICRKFAWFSKVYRHNSSSRRGPAGRLG